MTVKAVIVDDEYRIGQLISRLIHFDELDLELMKIFNCSTEAKDFILAEHPDIVISDIQMPVMDGLELIRQVKEAGADPHFILISGFREFEYARTALKYGVEEYLLKPIKEEELNRVLSEVIRKLSDDVQKKEETEKLQETARRVHTLAGRDAVSVLSRGYEGDIHAFSEAFQVNFREGSFLPLILQIDNEEPDTNDHLQDRFVANSIISMMEEEYRDSVYEQLYSAEESRTITGIMNFDPAEAESLIEHLRNHFLDIRSHAEVVPGYHVTLALGTICSFPEISTSIRTAGARALQRIVLGTGKVIADTPVDFASGTQDRLDASEIQRITNAAVSFNTAELRAVIEELFRKVRNASAAEAGKITSLAVNIIGCFFRSFAQSAQVSEEHRRIRSGISTCFSADMLEKMLVKELSEYLAEQGRSYQAQTRRPVREAIDYISKHYGEKITLETICEQLQMNASYFSTLFKKETGENFQNYLTAYRIEKAKELLRTTDDTMQAIADKVGYTDTRYFSQSFAKIVGIKPSLYRKMYS